MMNILWILVFTSMDMKNVNHYIHLVLMYEIIIFSTLYFQGKDF